MGPLRDFARSAAVAFVTSPLLSRSSAMHLSRANPNFMRSATFCSVKLSDSTTSVAEEVEEEESSCFKRFDSCRSK